ncbi:MAG: FapA family protein [Pseudomonadales bacterium]
MNKNSNQSPAAPGECDQEQAAQTFTAVSLLYDEKTQRLNAVLTPTDTDPNLDYQSLQELIKDQGYASFQVPGPALENVLRKIRSGETGSIELAEKPDYTAIELVYNPETRLLSAELSATDEDPKVNWTSLQALISENHYETFQIQGAVLQDLLKRAANKERGSFPLGEKPEYTDVVLGYDENSRVLSAILTATDEDPKITLLSLQEIIQANGYESYLPKGTELQALHKRLINKERGIFPLGEKPQYTHLQLAIDEQSNFLNATLTATDDNPNITLKSLQEAISSKNFDTLFFEEDALKKLFEQIKNKQWGVFPIAERKDAEIIITLSDDEMMAFITTTEAYGGKVLTAAEIKAAISNVAVEPSFCDQVALKQALESSAVTDLKFAEGKAPVDGLDAQFKALVEEVIYHAPTIDEDSGKADQHEIQDFTIVDVGKPVMQRIPATAGTNGSNVLGLMLPAQLGDDKPFATETLGVIVDPNDKNRLIADAKGHPVIMPDGVRVDKTLKVNNVDLRTGNITLDGSLLVVGEVKADMEINVTGDVIVNGIIDGATVAAGNDITIGGGVIGRELKSSTAHPLAAILTSGGNIKARFASFATITAGKNVEVAEYITHCDVVAREKLLVGQAGGKGRLFGGKCHAEDGMIANIVGTDADVKTLVSVGIASELQNNCDKLTEKKATATTQVAQLTVVFKQYMEAHKKQALSKEKLAKAKTIRNTVTSLKESIEALDKDLAVIKSEIKSAKKSDIIVQKIIYPGVLITVNGVELPIRKQAKGGRFIRDGDGVRWINV